jgi:hypothetical protein
MLEEFMKRVEHDPRIMTAHISIYISLWTLCKSRGSAKKVLFFSREVKSMCKISSYRTFCQRLKELHSFHYINYEPSFNPFEGSRVTFLIG